MALRLVLVLVLVLEMHGKSADEDEPFRTHRIELAFCHLLFLNARVHDLQN